jgi:hypothetical protein
MRLVNALQGITIVRITDEAIPPQGIIIQNLIAQIQARYRFAGRPAVAAVAQPNLQTTPTFQFQSGLFQSDDGVLPVGQMIYGGDSFMVVSQRTEQSDKIMDDLIGLLDGPLGFRVGKSAGHRYNVSNIVVQFGSSFEDKILKLRLIAEIVGKAVSKGKTLPGPVGLNRLSFTPETWNTGVVQLTADTADQADFVIERRVGRPYEDNWYFSGAPLSTSDHLKTLESIETALQD